MLLQKLSEYAERLELPPEMYAKTRVRWFIDIDLEGNLIGFVPLVGTGKKNDRGKELLLPNVLRSSGDRARLLADSGEYVLGVSRDPDKQKRTDGRHRLFKQLVHQCAQATDEQTVHAVKKFFDKWNPVTMKGKLPGDLDPSMNLTFRVGEVIPIDLPLVREFWARETADEDAREMQCVVCGRVKPVEERLPVKFKGIPGGEGPGTALISANAEAFESYGLHASLIAPTCRECGERFGNAANDLLRNDRTHLRIGPVVYVFWTREKTDFDPGSFLSKPDPVAVKSLIESVWKGKDRTALDDTEFYATAFSGSRGRVVVRDWLETTVGQVKRNLGRWFMMQRLLDPSGEGGLPLGMYFLAASLYPRQNQDADIAPNIPRALLRVALKGGALPEWLLFEAVRREKAEAGRSDKDRHWPNRHRMVLTKMVLVSNETEIGKEDAMERLDQSNREPAYVCGRLMAVLDAVQRAAIPGAKATIISRYFGTASSAPATVFGTLLRGAQPHLDKLRREREGAYYGLQTRLEEVLALLQSFPKTLTLKQQALFSLGYYHQRAADRAAARARKESKDTEQENEQSE